MHIPQHNLIRFKKYLFPVYALPAKISIQIHMLIKPFCYTLQNRNVDQSEIEGLPFLIAPDVAAQPWQWVALTVIQEGEIKVKEARGSFESSGTERARSPYSRRELTLGYCEDGCKELDNLSPREQ